MSSCSVFDYLRSRNRTAVVFLASLAVFLPALLIPRSGDDLTVRKTILFLSLAATLISGVWLLVRWDESRRLLRLRAGQGVLARWTLDRARWQWFGRHSHEWDQRQGVHANEVDFTHDPGDTGIDIVVGRDGILVGANFWPLEREVSITVHADWIEFHQVIPKPDGPPLRTVLRLPLQVGQERVAAELPQAHQRALQAPGARGFGPWHILWICLVGPVVATALIWVVATVTGWIE